MFGIGSSTPFGQSSSSPFGTQSIFGQTNNAISNPFAPKPFSSGPFGSPTGSSILGGTSTGVFGSTQSSSLLSSIPAFGASSPPAFGSSMPAFGASSAPAFGSSSSSLGGSSHFGQKPAFGGFGSTSTQTSPFGSGFQPTQPAFGSSLFGTTPAFGPAFGTFGPTSTAAFGPTSPPVFGTISTAAFGAMSIPAFGTTTNLALGATSTPAFGTTTTPAFGSTSTPAFGSTPTAAFGSVGAGFGLSSTPAFGASSSPPFGSSSIPTFGSSNPPFGSTSTPVFGSSSLFGSSSSSSFSFGSAPASGQSSSAFGSSSPFGSTFSFGVQSSPFGSQTTTPTFGSPDSGQSSFSSQHGGSRFSAYTPTTEVESSSTQPAGKLESISAMLAYKDKGHEELRWEDYQRGDKGGPSPANQPAGGVFSAPTQPNLFGPTGTFGQPAANPFSTSTSSNLFTPKTSTFVPSGFGGSSSPALNPPFGMSFAPSKPGFGSSSPAFSGLASMPAFISSLPSSSVSVPGANPFGSIFGTQSSGLFQSSIPPLGQTSGFRSTPLFGSTNLFNVPSTGFSGNLFTNNSSPPIFGTRNPLAFGTTTPTLSSAFQPVAPPHFILPVAAPSGGTSNVSGLAYFGQLSAEQNNAGVQLLPVTNPFGTLPAMPQLFVGRGVSSPSVQHGVPSIPVGDKPTQRVSSLFKPRHLSQRRITRASKYHPKDSLKAPFYYEYEEIPSMPNAGAFFVPRENPRALVILPVDQWPRRSGTGKQSPLKETDQSVQTNGETPGMASSPNQNGSSQNQDQNQPENVFNGKKGNASLVKPVSKADATHEDHTRNTDSFVTIAGHEADESAVAYEFGADIEALMPKLRHSDYYTEPQIQEVAAKERAKPGSCSRVKNFLVGRHGYGSIKFFGETDIRHLDLESLVQFNNREVIVYMDENKKPPIGQGLNKPAEVTLLNVKCINKKTGEQYTGGPKVERYKDMLMKKTQEQGAKFVSFDAVKGEWKFKVDHFSHYELTDNP